MAYNLMINGVVIETVNTREEAEELRKKANMLVNGEGIRNLFPGGKQSLNEFFGFDETPVEIKEVY